VLHDVANEGPIDYLVMEFLQGESLADRLRKGPLPAEQVLTIAIEIASDIWVVDLARHTKTRITFGPLYSGEPVWWPDGKSIIFSYGPNGATDALCRQNADGTGSKEKLLETPGVIDYPFSVTPDGRYIAYMRFDPKWNTRWDIWALPMFVESKPFPVVSTSFFDVTPAFSPDGKWLAYANNETGRLEIYIQPFPSGAGRWQVSTAGGIET
jgi:eukaryotic-like serine/threonine-protein kinase